MIKSKHKPTNQLTQNPLAYYYYHLFTYTLSSPFRMSTLIQSDPLTQRVEFSWLEVVFQVIQKFYMI